MSETLEDISDYLTPPHERMYISPTYAIAHGHTAEKFPDYLPEPELKRLTYRVKRAFPSAPKLILIYPFYFPLAVIKNYTKFADYRHLPIPTATKIVQHMTVFMGYSDKEILKLTSIKKKSDLHKMLKVFRKYYAK